MYKLIFAVPVSPSTLLPLPAHICRPVDFSKTLISLSVLYAQQLLHSSLVNQIVCMETFPRYCYSSRPLSFRPSLHT